MPDVPDRRPAVSSLLITALFLAARSHLGRLHLSRPTTKEIFEATGATRSRAYELMEALLTALPDLEKKVGRPRAEPPVPLDMGVITLAVLRFVTGHPGCVHQHAARSRYSDVYRHFILELCERHHDVPLQTFAQAADLALGTLKDWLRGGLKEIEGSLIITTPSEPATPSDPATPSRVETLVAQWKTWEGCFNDFCTHVSYNLRIPYGRTLIASILEQHGARTPKRRAGRSADEKALRDSFETFFPGAQWAGDGSPLAVQIGEQHFNFNLELMVNVFSAAHVGASLRDEEDSQAVVLAFEDGVTTTGAPPLCTLLDNRFSNHTPVVEQALAETLVLRATKGRPQNKAHVEGAFGLFAQVVPLIAITATSPKEMARQLLELVVQVWCRTLNHRPRKNRQGRSRVDIHQGVTPTPEEIEEARLALEERYRKQELARRTLEARQDPVVRATLDEAFARLALKDPQGNIRSAIARYPLDAVVAAIATFEGKRNALTLPNGIDGGRYLLGIVRNLAEQNEGLRIAEALLQARLEARDRILVPLQQTLDDLQKTKADSIEGLKAMTDLALADGRHIDRLFWLIAIADHIVKQPQSRHAALLGFVARRIHASFALRNRDRQDAVRFLFAKVIPLE